MTLDMRCEWTRHYVERLDAICPGLAAAPSRVIALGDENVNRALDIMLTAACGTTSFPAISVGREALAAVMHADEDWLLAHLGASIKRCLSLDEWEMARFIDLLDWIEPGTLRNAVLARTVTDMQGRTVYPGVAGWFDPDHMQFCTGHVCKVTPEDLVRA